MAFARPPDVQADQDSLGIRQIADDLEKSVRFSMFEEFHLPKPLFSGLLCLVRPAQILSAFRQHFVAILSFLDHGDPPT
jgi:hypothetical protein